ncbi:hypothetical protein GCM10023175_10210 [Pseudonocardia xishanensis]|uniref:Uncharacterized protein n=1 Tax=Pseudonocardia xishanensis TaxID=630995 RepID=A0ABP8RHX9_9PSEU
MLPAFPRSVGDGPVASPRRFARTLTLPTAAREQSSRSQLGEAVEHHPVQLLPHSGFHMRPTLELVIGVVPEVHPL